MKLITILPLNLSTQFKLVKRDSLPLLPDPKFKTFVICCVMVIKCFFFFAAVPKLRVGVVNWPPAGFLGRIVSCSPNMTAATTFFLRIFPRFLGTIWIFTNHQDSEMGGFWSAAQHCKTCLVLQSRKSRPPGLRGREAWFKNKIKTKRPPNWAVWPGGAFVFLFFFSPPKRHNKQQFPSFFSLWGSQTQEGGNSFRVWFSQLEFFSEHASGHHAQFNWKRPKMGPFWWLRFSAIPDGERGWLPISGGDFGNVLAV